MNISRASAQLLETHKKKSLNNVLGGLEKLNASHQYEKWCGIVFSSRYGNRSLPKCEFHTTISFFEKCEIHKCLREGLSCRERKEKGKKERAAKADLFEYSQSIFLLLQTRLLKKSISSRLLTQAGASQGLLEQCQSQRH